MGTIPQYTSASAVSLDKKVNHFRYLEVQNKKALKFHNHLEILKSRLSALFGVKFRK